jgi:hypothetical protein
MYQLCIYNQNKQYFQLLRRWFVGHNSVQAAVMSPEVEPNVFAGQRVQEVDPASEYEPGGQVPEQDEFVKRQIVQPLGVDPLYVTVEPEYPAAQVKH